MVEQLESLWPLIAIVIHVFHVLRKALSMPLPLPLPWERIAEPPAHSLKRARGASKEAGLAGCGFREPSPAAEARKPTKRPPTIVIPESCFGEGSAECFGWDEEDLGKEMEVEGSGYCLNSKRGARHRMEDGFEVITGIHGDSKQAFFGVFDGHGGRAAVNFVSEKLGKNILHAVEQVDEKDEEDRFEAAIKAGYMRTDHEFLSQGVRSGVCAATVLLKDGELYVANVGDCRVVMSKNGVADALTNDHRLDREDEKIRIENLGGYVNCHKGVWRVDGSLAVSRAIGDISLKEWIISEPETRRLHLTPECDFLILASDGLWDKVGNQEAVDIVKRQGNLKHSCNDLVEISNNRGNRDDITVMVVDLQNFL
ncbi:putative protein phosphatase 2C 77 [Apostasia shenzhenica]|uniref:protein-serine/threonine phosphatase n=1 Tax=Apostasia shenzhenica TaxID=1088818 RepID=A0A2I0AG67_9ASPA|nr:putative protein phosphatase 2C 77 [Apostasia shenzhenica]